MSTTGTTFTKVMQPVDYVFDLGNLEVRISLLRNHIQAERDEFDYCRADNNERAAGRAAEKWVKLTDELDVLVAKRDACLADYLTLLGR